MRLFSLHFYDYERVTDEDVILRDEGGSYEASGRYGFSQFEVRITFVKESEPLFGAETFRLRRVSQNRICTVLRGEQWCFDFVG